MRVKGVLALVVALLWFGCNNTQSEDAPAETPRGPSESKAAKSVRSVASVQETEPESEMAVKPVSVEDFVPLVNRCLPGLRSHMVRIPPDFRTRALASQTLPCLLPAAPIIPKFAMHQKQTYTPFALAEDECYLQALDPMLSRFQQLAQTQGVQEEEKWLNESFETTCPEAQQVWDATLALLARQYSGQGAFGRSRAACQQILAEDKQQECLTATRSTWNSLPGFDDAGWTEFVTPNWPGAAEAIETPFVLDIQEEFVTLDGEIVCEEESWKKAECRDAIAKRLEARIKTAMMLYQKKRVDRIPALGIVLHSDELPALSEIEFPGVKVPTFALLKGNRFPRIVRAVPNQKAETEQGEQP